MSSNKGKKKDKFRKKQDLRKYHVNIKVGVEVRQLLKVATKAPLKSDRARACYDLAYCFTEGKGVGGDILEAVKWLDKASELGHAGAKSNLASHFVHGTGGKRRDIGQATKLYKEAAAGGDIMGQFNLANCYCHGEGVPQDFVQAEKWLRMAADGGHAPSMQELGEMLCYGEEGVKQDLKQAIALFQKAADTGLPNAKFSLANCYTMGLGVDKDEQRAIRLFTQASDKGQERASYNLARFHHLGEHGCEKSFDEAERFYRRAIKQGSVAASAGLASLKASGADKQGALKALRKAQKAYDGATGVYKDLERAIALNVASLGPNCSMHHCQGCGITNALGGKSIKLKVCARCRKIAYCSSECQKKDWKAGHKKVCEKQEA